MKVLVVTAEPECAPLNGVGKFVWEFSREMKKECEVKIFCLQMDPFVIPEKELPPADPAYKADYSIRIEYDWYTESVEARHMFAAHRALPYVKSVLAEFAPDIVYLQGPKVWFPFRHEKNVIVAFHGLVKDIVGTNIADPCLIAQERWETEAALRAGSVVLFSRFMEKGLKRAYGLSKDVAVLPLGINAETYRSEKDPKEFRVSFFGRLVDAQKGYLSFLDAVCDLPSSTGDGRSISFHVWGKGESVDGSAYPSVQFHGHVNDAELVSAFASSDVVVMPSRYEPFGYVALEALASGCILLAITGQGMDEFLEPEKNFVAITADSASIKKELKKVFEQPERYFDLGQEGLRSAAEWSWKRSVDAHLALFMNVLEAAPAAAESWNNS